MDTRVNKTIVCRLYEAVNTQDLSSLKDFIASDFIDHSRKIHGLEALKRFGTMIFNAFPDFHETMEDIIAADNKVWVRNTITGTHLGEFRGIAPTGKTFTETSVDIFRIVNGKLIEGWNVTNELDFYKQIGAIEYTRQGQQLFTRAHL